MRTIKKKNEEAFRGDNWPTFYPKAKVCCYLEFKFRYLKNLKLFSIRVKELNLGL